MTEPLDLAGVLAVIRDSQQQIAFGFLASDRQEWRCIQAHLVNAQRSLSSAERELTTMLGGDRGHRD